MIRQTGYYWLYYWKSQQWLVGYHCEGAWSLLGIDYIYSDNAIENICFIGKFILPDQSVPVKENKDED